MGLCTPTVTPGAPGEPGTSPSSAIGKFKGRTAECLKSCCTLPTVMKVTALIGALILAAAALTFVPAIGGALSAAVGASAISCAILGFAVGGALVLASGAHYGYQKYQAYKADKAAETL